MRPLDLVVLQTFVAVVDSGGFTAAAEQLHLAQPTVSAHMARLEHSLGRRVLRRDRRAVTPTPEGERLLAHARQMLRQSAMAFQDVRQERLAGRVRLGIPEDYVLYLPSALAAFESRYPAVELEVECGLSVDLVTRVHSGELDVAVVTRQPKSPGGEVLRREPLAWAGALDHATFERDPLPLALSQQGVCIFRERALAALDTAGIAWRVAYTSASLSGLRSAVRAGLAITVLPPSMLDPQLRSLTSAEGLPDLPGIELALHRSPGRPSDPARQLVAQLQESLSEGPAMAPAAE
ncbi:MAG: LysR substrate-binding domain-containing protein [Halofilum sp. (in: g-proteobacteria)]